MLGKDRQRKTLLITNDVLDLCDERGDLKKMGPGMKQAEVAKAYREAKKRIQNAVKKAMEDCL